VSSPPASRLPDHIRITRPVRTADDKYLTRPPYVAANMARSNSITSISSISSRSSRASSTEAEPTMQIFVKDVAGDSTSPFLPPHNPHQALTSPTPAFPLTVPQSTTVSTLRKLLALRTNLPELSLRIIHAGKHLPPSSTLASHNIARESTRHIALPLLGGAPPKKQRCNATACKDAAQRIVGDCGFCQGHFCGKHRMLESHECPGLEGCKQEEKERNAQKLESERTAPMKGIGAA